MIPCSSVAHRLAYIFTPIAQAIGLLIKRESPR
jgi:hypothetical protein